MKATRRQTSRPQTLCVIWAMSRNRVIGAAGGLPWHLPDELRHFTRTTLGKPVIMGRRTFESAGHPLPGRRNIVLSRSGFRAPGAHTAATLDAALALAAEDGGDACFVIGGTGPYAEALPRAARLYATTVEACLPGDTVLPAFDMAPWLLVSEAHHPADERHAFAYTIRVYDRSASSTGEKSK